MFNKRWIDFISIPSFLWGEKMNEKRKIEYQQKMISRQSKQIEELKSQVEKLKLECEKKDETIASVDFLKKEMIESVEKYKKLKNEFESLIDELKKMKEIMNAEVYRGRWKLIRFLIK